MKKTFVLLLALVLFSSHDMFLKLDTYFLPANSPAQIKLFNGTFDRSENTIDRDRMLDASLVGNGERIQVAETQWSEKDSMTILSFETSDAGTWVAGVSTRPRDFEMAAADFNQYLEHDGVLDMLNWRTANEALDEDAVERYSKHVKAIFQVGEERSDDWQTVLGYPIELVPLANPYELEVKDVLPLQLLWQGEPLGNQLIYADVTRPTHGHGHDHGAEHAHEHSSTEDHSHAGDEGHAHSHEAAHDHANSDAHDHAHGDGHDHAHDHGADSHSHSHEPELEEEEHSHANEMLFRTDRNGRFSLPISAEGIWYLRTIYLTHSDEPGLTHESNWTTLTFEVGHSHSEGTHTHADGTEHEHHHEDELGVPSYVFWLGSLALIGALFFWFNRKQG